MILSTLEQCYLLYLLMLISPQIAQTLLKRAIPTTFNAITVDSDQSTNDMVTLFATKKIKIGQNKFN